MFGKHRCWTTTLHPANTRNKSLLDQKWFPVSSWSWGVRSAAVAWPQEVKAETCLLTACKIRSQESLSSGPACSCCVRLGTCHSNKHVAWLTSVYRDLCKRRCAMLHACKHLTGKTHHCHGKKHLYFMIVKKQCH